MLYVKLHKLNLRHEFIEYAQEYFNFQLGFNNVIYNYFQLL